MGSSTAFLFVCCMIHLSSPELHWLCSSDLQRELCRCGVELGLSENLKRLPCGPPVAHHSYKSSCRIHKEIREDSRGEKHVAYIEYQCYGYEEEKISTDGYEEEKISTGLQQNVLERAFMNPCNKWSNHHI